MKRLSIKGLLRENISYLRFLTNRNIFYGISLSHEQTNEFALVSIGKEVLQSALCVWVYSCSDTINSIQVLSSVGNSKFLKNALLLIRFPHV